MKRPGTFLVVSMLLAAGLCAADADARTTRRRAYFLAADPHVPLVVVRDGRVRQAVPDAARGHACGSPRRWATVGSRWHALDAWGQITATRTVAAKDDYDVTGCAELALSPKRKDDLVSILVSADSDWSPAPSVQWAAGPAARASFEALFARLMPGRMAAKELPPQCAAIADRFRYFDVPGSGAGAGHWAVGASDGGYVVASFARGAWSVSLSERQRGKGLFATCHRPVAVFDMNGDGRPEIVLRYAEPTSWSDFVLELGPAGRWREVATSPGGSTA